MFAGTMTEMDEHIVTNVSRLRCWQQSLSCHLNAVFPVMQLEEMCFFKTHYTQTVSEFCVSQATLHSAFKSRSILVIFFFLIYL